MTETKQSRGRPKGTGIDDRIWLREMERLMRIDPALRPTSAIKALGITDPSTIRRLRDKHAALHGQDATSHQAEQPSRESSASARHRVAVQQAKPDPVIRRRPALVASNPGPAPNNDPAAAERQSQSPLLAGADAFSLMLGLGVQTMLLCAQATTTMMLAIARQSPASILLQQQLAASDAFAATIRQQFDARARALDR